MFAKYVRGMVYWCDLPKYEQNANVQAGIRPVIIISNNVGNVFSKNVTIIPCTTNTEKNPDQCTHVRLDLSEDSLALCEMILTVSKDLLKGFMGMLDEHTMKQIDNGIKSALGLIDVPFPEKKTETKEVKLEQKRKKNVGRRISSTSDMHAFIQYAATHTNAETMAEYGIPTSTAVSQRLNYYKRKLKVS